MAIPVTPPAPAMTIAVTTPAAADPELVTLALPLISGVAPAPSSPDKCACGAAFRIGPEPQHDRGPRDRAAAADWIAQADPVGLAADARKLLGGRAIEYHPQSACSITEVQQLRLRRRLLLSVLRKRTMGYLVPAARGWPLGGSNSAARSGPGIVDQTAVGLSAKQ